MSYEKSKKGTNTKENGDFAGLFQLEPPRPVFLTMLGVTLRNLISTLSGAGHPKAQTCGGTLMQVCPGPLWDPHNAAESSDVMTLLEHLG